MNQTLQIFMLGMTFADAKEAREALAKYTVSVDRRLKIRPNEPGRIIAKCVKNKGCDFLVFISKDGKNPSLVVKNLQLEHNCYRTFKNPIVTTIFLANHFKPLIYKNHETTVKELMNLAELQMKVKVSHIMCKRAKRIIKQRLYGSYVKEFECLEAYATALKRSNSRSSVEIELCRDNLRVGRRVFRHMFICFSASIGKDADDQIYPITWAVIDTENTRNWRWFLQMLGQELDLSNGSEITLIYDMQKGLIEDVKELLSNAEYRWCARHIWAN
ncbi:uncharacterized protein LOC126687582 [Mercurialis annua]|uniref:uncharacterized protein LOC126687582 n=1 Tax=Mercurialis annua TaxID=3986 RepID=UPI00216007B0|nr:uncharacterized protein LOC126687582 [Mercurialis annua]